MTKHRVTRRLLAVALSVLLVLGCVAPAVAATYESGTYTGTGTGRNGSVALTLTLTNGAIASVDNVTHSETARYWEKAKVLLDRLVGLQTPEQVEKLDAVTGATLSSNAIKEAAKDVFRQAESKETPVFASGSGTKSDPYLIRTAAQLQAFAAAVNGGTGYEGQYISLDADLDLTGTAWTPIGATGSFNGSFNGNYHTITGMTIGSESEKASYTEAGLFGSVGKGAAIRNVGVINAAIYNKTTTDPSVGLLAAGISENSIVESCWATGTIYSDTTSPYYSYVGGLVGSIGIKSLICNSWTNVVVYAKGSSDSFVGGIVGDTGNNSAVVNCAALGSVANYGNTSMMYGAGGVVGYSSGAVYASYSSSRIHMDAMSYDDGADVPVGGVVGSPSALSAAYNCYFNKEEKQTYYDGEVSTPLAVGYDVLNYSESDNDHCEGLTAAEIASETLLNKLTAALTPEVKLCAPIYPFLCDFRRVAQLDLMKDAYEGFSYYFKKCDPTHAHEQEFFERLGYIDLQNHASAIRAQVFWQTGLMDTLCPPSAQFSAYNKLTGRKEMKLYPEYGHEQIPYTNDTVFSFLRKL